MSASTDLVHRFLFDELDIRGAHVRLGSSWQAILAGRDYPAPVRTVLGEMCAISTLIAANLKQAGRLTFQLSGDGLVPMLVVDCNASLNLRGYAALEAEVPADADLTSLLGNGRLLMTLDLGQSHIQPFQSYVAIEGKDTSEVFATYLERSEQCETWLMLVADGEGAAGLFLQKLPEADRRDADGWSRITQLAQTIKREELLGLDAATLLTRLFHEETVRLFEPSDVTHDFPPDPDKISTMLRSLGRDEIERILAEHGEVQVSDDLSNNHYRFSAEEARRLFDEPPTLH
ncbi:MAG: Hsp33 family molecular chaperone HslO [Rhodocyclaceae bacterium]